AAALEQAIVQERGAALLVGPAEQAIANAEKDVAVALEQARERALRIVQERLEFLRRGDHVLVEQMDEVDRLMDLLTWQLHRLCIDPLRGTSPPKFDLRGQSGEQPDRVKAMLRVTMM